MGDSSAISWTDATFNPWPHRLEAGRRVSSYAEVIKLARLDDYGEGVAHGFETTLRLLLGEPVDGVPPYDGPLPPECEAWARDALARLTEAGR